VEDDEVVRRQVLRTRLTARGYIIHGWDNASRHHGATDRVRLYQYGMIERERVAGNDKFLKVGVLMPFAPRAALEVPR